MKKLTFPVIMCLCLALLCSCAEKAPAVPASDGEAVPLAAAPAGTSDSAAAPETAGTPEGGVPALDEPGVEKIPMLMLGGELYCDTGEVSDEPRCGMMDGEISSSVESWERPAGDGQSNFGSGYGWQYGHEEGTVEVSIDGQWRVFQKRSEMRVRYLDAWFDAADVSDETLRWLLWYNSLDKAEQLCVSFTPLDLYELCGYPLAGDMPADAEG